MSKVSRAIGQVRNAFFGIIARANAVSAQITGLSEEVMDEIEIIQHVGFASWIPESSRVVIVPLHGKSSRSIIVGSTEAPVMITVSEGETCIYDQFGHQILLSEEGALIKANTKIVGKLTVTEGIESNGDISDKTSSMQEMRDIYNNHTNGNTPSPNQKM